jgi:hypothetical protein
MKQTRWLTAVVMTAAVALGAAACGDDESEQPASTPTATAKATEAASVSPQEAMEGAAAHAEEETAAKPNLFGGTGPIARVLPRLEKDVDLFYQESLSDTSAKLTAPTVTRTAGTCNDKPVQESAPPQWCDAENTVFTSEAGADQIRNDESAAGLYTLVAWAHARAAGAQLGWHRGVSEGRYPQSLVTQAEVCFLFSWVRYTYQQGVFEDSDWADILASVNAHLDLFPALSSEVFNKAAQSAFEGGSEACVAS